MKPDFANAYSKANEILVKSNVITTFPFSPIQLVKELTPFVCCSYSKAQKYGFDVRQFGSESAVIVTYGEKTIIFYEEKKSMNHVGFSILHELGHPINGHDLSVKDEETYGKYEVETNYFAAQLLMPEQLLREFQHRGIKITSDFLQKNFGVSDEAAKKRISTLAKTKFEWYSRAEKQFDDVILFKYSSFINNICPHKLFDLDDEYEKQKERDNWY